METLKVTFANIASLTDGVMYVAYNPKTGEEVPFIRLGDSYLLVVTLSADVEGPGYKIGDMVCGLAGVDNTFLDKIYGWELHRAEEIIVVRAVKR